MLWRLIYSVIIDARRAVIQQYFTQVNRAVDNVTNNNATLIIPTGVHYKALAVLALA